MTSADQLTMERQTSGALTIRPQNLPLADGAAKCNVAKGKLLIHLREIGFYPIDRIGFAGKALDAALVATVKSDDHVPAGAFFVREGLHDRSFLRIHRHQIQYAPARDRFPAAMQAPAEFPRNGRGSLSCRGLCRRIVGIWIARSAGAVAFRLAGAHQRSAGAGDTLVIAVEAEERFGKFRRGQAGPVVDELFEPVEHDVLIVMRHA